MKSKSMFRPIEDGEDISDIIKKLLISEVLLVVLFFLIMAGWGMYKHSGAIKENDFDRQFRQLQADPDWIAQQKRLHKQHGKGRVIIYEQNKEPYYYDERGRRCRFI